ncbi:sphingosine-1-phosphate phosphatase 2-like [Contarinia nasturtii]|uniref:sphingosine-1-phosphate phosphatase 2-like n=1 Tax=Contarinia nasturtii TaxID=265458 RepID=UPI0012D3DE8A|nr:sphingosine-1-phosphate phosphatase 2-like [Contarinia nasturtii]
MWSIVEYLRKPELVVTVQEWFGIEYDDTYDQIEKEQTFYGQNNISPNLEMRKQYSNYPEHKKQRRKQISDDCASDVKKSQEESVNVDESTGSYQITNKFWYYLFLLGTELGDEIFYATMIPFWFWNIDGAVGRRVVFIWSVIMYIGQVLKDIIRWPRPGRPVHRLQNKWSIEYGMPSTHAMVAVAMPFSVVIFMLDRYQFSATNGFLIAFVWCLIVCVSRIYLGMHSVADVIAGIFLTILLMIPLIPLVDKLDHIILSSTFSPLFVIGIPILLIIYYPCSEKWTPTRGDTTTIISVGTGILMGAWLNYQLGAFQPPEITSTRPYEIIWPTQRMLGLILLRTILGLCGVIATRALGKSIAYAVVCMLLGRDQNEVKASESTLENRDKIIVELSYKFFVYSSIGFIVNCLLPNVFKMLNIGRPDFYTEI